MAKRKSTGAKAPQYKFYVRKYEQAVKKYNSTSKRYRGVHAKYLKNKGSKKLQASNRVMYKRFKNARNTLNKYKRTSGYKKYRNKQKYHGMFNKLRKDGRHQPTIDGAFLYIAAKNPISEYDYVYLKLNTEEPNYTNNLDTSSTPEKGKSLTASSERELVSVTISGMIGGTSGYNYRKVKADETRIARWSNNSENLYVRGQLIYPEVVITSFTPQHTTDGYVNAMNVSVTFTKANYAESTIQDKRKPKKKGKKSKSKGVGKNKATKYKIRRGDSYFSIARRYGVSVSTLESKNHYPATNLPVGEIMHI